MNDYRVRFLSNKATLVNNRVVTPELFLKVSAKDFNEAEENVKVAYPDAKIIETKLLKKTQERKNIDHLDPYYGPSYGSECEV